MLTITVSQLNRYVKSVLEGDGKLRDVYVKGEIAGFVRHNRSGHCYFRMVDGESGVKAVMFRQYSEALGFLPEDGMAVLARCSVGAYERDGVYQLYVTELMPEGAGAMAVALAQRKARLEKLGVFDPSAKKRLPLYPNRIGVATSAAGAALQDIRTVLERRWPLCTLVLAPALVQGAQAPQALIGALERLDSAKCDVIILSRGGGSKEDLSAFNDEGVVLAVYRCETPVISAVGHEVDYTLCDYAADSRAPTPSAAAELAVPDRQELLRRVAGYGEGIKRGGGRFIGNRQSALGRISSHPVMKTPANTVNKCKEKVDIYTKALYNSKRIIMQELTASLGERASRLDALSPLGVLSRGYCLAVKDKLVAGAGSLTAGDEVSLKFHDGGARARVLEVSREAVRGDEQGE